MGNLTNATDFSETKSRLSKLNPGLKPLWGRMTVNEMICHVADPFRDLLGVRQTKPILPGIFRPIMKAILFGKKPYSRNLPTLKPYLQGERGGGTRPTDFEHDKAMLLNLVDQFVATDANYSFYPHPGAGKLTREENGYLMWKHLDHHLRQFGV